MKFTALVLAAASAVSTQAADIAITSVTQNANQITVNWQVLSSGSAPESAVLSGQFYRCAGNCNTQNPLAALGGNAPISAKTATFTLPPNVPTANDAFIRLSTADGSVNRFSTQFSVTGTGGAATANTGATTGATSGTTASVDGTTNTANTNKSTEKKDDSKKDDSKKSSAASVTTGLAGLMAAAAGVCAVLL
jgi:hypothetical protein